MIWLGIGIGLFFGVNIGIFGLAWYQTVRHKGSECLDCPWFIESCGKILTKGNMEEK